MTRTPDPGGVHIVLLVTSPRLPAGLLSAAAWDLVRSHPVFAEAENEQVAALRAAGASVTVVPADADALLDRARGGPAGAPPDSGTEGAPPAGGSEGAPPAGGSEGAPPEGGSEGAPPAGGSGPGTVVWLAGPAGDEDFARRLGLRLTREPGGAQLELVYGSWDPPGARLLDAVTVMDQLMAPDGGDPWKRQQTHASLAQYLLEEAYEAYDAIVADDLDALREELGDVLLQVVLHARLAHEQGEQAFTVDDVAGDLVDKLIRRNPHVFAGMAVAGVDEIIENWEQIKRAEKARDSAVDGVVLGQPALALAAKLLSRAERAGLTVPLPAADESLPPADGDALGTVLLRLVAAARAGGLDAEAALRQVALRYADAIRAAERDQLPPG